MTRAGPLKAILDIRREELPFALAMFGYFFLVITSFWILKPIKKALFIQFYDQAGFQVLDLTLNAAQAELIAKVLNMVVAFLAVIVFTWLARRFYRQSLAFIFTAFFLAGYVLYSYLVETPRDLAVWTFYLFGDLFATLMVATFFAFLNDSVTPEAAKRLFGLVVLGGVTGGVFGTTVVRVMIDRISVVEWLWIAFGLGLVILVLAYAAGRLVPGLAPPDRPSQDPVPVPDAGAQAGGNPAVEGARLVFRSSYMLSIVAIVGLYEVVSTIMDFQFTSTIAHYLDGPAIGEMFSTVFAITNVIAMVVQLFLTSLVMSRFGVGVALCVLPFAVLSGSGAMLALPVLWVGGLLNTADNGFAYSINQSAKEALYVPATRDEKYKAKAFIDMFVQRFAKAIAVGISLVITLAVEDFSGVRWLSLVTIPLVLLWLLAVRHAGRRFETLSAVNRA